MELFWTIQTTNYIYRRKSHNVLNFFYLYYIILIVYIINYEID